MEALNVEEMMMLEIDYAEALGAYTSGRGKPAEEAYRQARIMAVAAGEE